MLLSKPQNNLSDPKLLNITESYSDLFFITLFSHTGSLCATPNSSQHSLCKTLQKQSDLSLFLSLSLCLLVSIDQF